MAERKCRDCPEWTQTVCRHAFGAFWNEKSGGGEGCGHPLDEAAEAWHKAGWTPPAPDAPKTPRGAFPVAGGVVILSRPPDASQARSRASGALPPEKAPRMPRRPVRPTAPCPPVSAEIMRQADLFFRRAGNG